MPKVFTPDTLAKEWSCSGQHIRNLISRGELRAFKLGGKLLRIRAEDVEDFLVRNSTWTDG
jgi:excisionase family DNA binding protein